MLIFGAQIGSQKLAVGYGAHCRAWGGGTLRKSSFDTVWGRDNPTLTSEYEALRNFSPDLTSGSRTPES